MTPSQTTANNNTAKAILERLEPLVNKIDAQTSEMKTELAVLTPEVKRATEMVSKHERILHGDEKSIGLMAELSKIRDYISGIDRATWIAVGAVVVGVVNLVFLYLTHTN